MKFFLTVPAFAALLLLFSISPAIGQKRKPVRPFVKARVAVTTKNAAKPAAVSPEQQRRRDAFSKAWQTLNENYFDKTFNGLDWNKVRGEYQPRVNAAKSDQEVHKIIEEMIARLDRSHFGLIPPEYFANLKTAKAAARKREKLMNSGGQNLPDAKTGQKPESSADESEDEDEDLLLEESKAKYGIGVDIRLIDNRFVITSVEQQSGASIAGLKPGYIIDKINGIPLSDLVSRIIFANTNVRHIQRYMPTQIVSLFLNGEKDTSVFITCLDETDAPKNFKVPRLQLSGETISIGERYPEQFLRFETRSLTTDVGYIKFNLFALPVVDKFCAALSDFAEKKAIIVDLRGNFGGLIGTLTALTGMLTDHPVVVGTSQYRMGSEVMRVAPKAKNYSGRVVFLVDGQSMSASELFSAGLQEDGRITVVGDRTAGEALPALSTKLSTGAVFVYPIASFKTQKGRMLEGNGVEPDFAVPLSRKSLLNGIDNQLAKAIEVTNDNSLSKTSSIDKGEIFTRISGDPLPPPVRIAASVPNGSVESPPPPPPLARKTQSDKIVSLSAAPGVPKLVVESSATLPPAKDAKALEAITDFTAAVGGRENWAKLGSYVAIGRSLIGLRGSETEFKMQAFRQEPGKYAVILSTDALGEVREVHAGKTSFVQSDYGVDNDTSTGRDQSETQLFETVVTAINPDSFETLHFGGLSTIDSANPITLLYGTTKYGQPIALSFNANTKLLIRVVSGPFSYVFGDYRKIEGGLTVPFQIKLEGMMDVRLDSVTVNAKIDPTIFEKKIRCFDTPLKPNLKSDLKN